MTQRPTWDECPECSERFERKVWNARYCSEKCRATAGRRRNRDKNNAAYRDRYAKVGYAEHIKKKYGVTMEWYTEHSANGCEACGSIDRLVVDHDHETGDARGVLCFGCNIALGHAKDDPNILRRIASYIERA